MSEAKKKRYRVTGIHRTCGHPPGAVFEAELSAEQEAALVQGGALRVEAAADVKVTTPGPRELSNRPKGRR